MEWIVVVSRCGVVRIEADTAEEAKQIVDDQVTSEEVDWDDDWPAVDAYPAFGDKKEG